MDPVLWQNLRHLWSHFKNNFTVEINNIFLCRIRQIKQIFRTHILEVWCPISGWWYLLDWDPRHPGWKPPEYFTTAESITQIFMGLSSTARRSIVHNWSFGNISGITKAYRLVWSHTCTNWGQNEPTHAFRAATDTCKISLRSVNVSTSGWMVPPPKKKRFRSIIEDSHDFGWGMDINKAPVFWSVPKFLTYRHLAQ